MACCPSDCILCSIQPSAAVTLPGPRSFPILPPEHPHPPYQISISLLRRHRASSSERRQPVDPPRPFIDHLSAPTGSSLPAPRRAGDAVTPPLSSTRALPRGSRRVPRCRAAHAAVLVDHQSFRTTRAHSVVQLPLRCHDQCYLLLPLTKKRVAPSSQVPMILVLLLRQQSMACLGYGKISPRKGWLPVKRTCMFTVSTGCHQVRWDKKLEEK